MTFQKTTLRFFAAASLALLFAAPAFAKNPQLPFEVPSKGKPEPKTCEGRCDRDKGDCDAMCKSVANAQGSGACKKACVDVKNQCMDDCKSNKQ